MSRRRFVLVVNLDPGIGEDDVAPYMTAGQIQLKIQGVRSVDVRDLEPGDDLVKLSVVLEGVRRGLEPIAPDLYEDATAEEQRAAERPCEYAWAPHTDAPTEAIVAQRRAEAAARLAEQLAAEQARKRAELEAYDRRAAERAAGLARQRAAEQAAHANERCRGNCSRGGDGPPCGLRGCDG